MFRSTILAACLIAAGGFGSGAMASAPSAADRASTPSSQASRQSTQTEQATINPDNRMCLRHTGSLIPPKRGECINAVGTSYSAEDLRRTGQPNTGAALQMLDPRIRVGH
ncbi:MAG: hypothetical protein ABI389_06275 [Rhodanobacter sp.]